MTENLNFELMKELRFASARMMHPGKNGPDRGTMHGKRSPMPGMAFSGNREMHSPEGRHGMGHGMREMPGQDCRPWEGKGDRGYGIHPLPREFVLSVLMEQGNTGIRQKDLAEKIGIRPAAMSEAIDKLEDNGYIERKVDESDRRATLIFLTEKGEARANEIRDQREHRFDRLFGELSAEEKEQLLILLRKMNKRSE